MRRPSLRQGSPGKFLQKWEPSTEEHKNPLSMPTVLERSGTNDSKRKVHLKETLEVSIALSTFYYPEVCDMKFHAAWDSIEKENRNLKILTIALCTLAIFLTVAVTSTATKEPVIVERGCHSKMAATAENSKPSEEEIAAFTEKALGARFDTRSENLEYLAFKQRAFRDKEQIELSKQNMTQKVIVNDTKVTKDAVLVTADRLISIGKIRSVLRFPLRVLLESTDRTESNPYGLLLSDVNPIEEEKKE